MNIGLDVITVRRHYAFTMNGQALRDARHAKGLTLKQLSEASGVVLSTISDIEHGRIEAPNYKTVVTLAGALGVDPSILWPVELPPAVNA